MRAWGEGRGLTRLSEKAYLGAPEDRVVYIGHHPDANAALVEAKDGLAELRAGEGEEAEIQGAARRQDARQEAAQLAVAVRQRARARDRGRAGSLNQQLLGARQARREKNHLARRSGPPPPQQPLRHRLEDRAQPRRQHDARHAARAPHCHCCLCGACALAAHR